MHFLNSAIVALIAGGAAAFTLPAGLKDGTYSVHYDKEGREVHEQLATANNIAFSRRQEEGLSLSPLSKRQLNEYTYYCGCGFPLNHGDCDAAVADLSNQLNKGPKGGCAIVPQRSSYYSIRGAVVAFVCVGPGLGFKLCGQDYGDILKQVTGACGLYIAGTEEIVSYDPDVGTGVTPVGEAWSGYMQYFSGLDFCGAAAGSSAHSC